MSFTPPHSSSRTLNAWANFHGTIEVSPVDNYIEIDADPVVGGPLKRHMEAVTSLVRHAFSGAQMLCTHGAKWSLSPILRPEELLVSPWRMTSFNPIGTSVMEPWFTVPCMTVDRGIPNG